MTRSTIADGVGYAPKLNSCPYCKSWVEFMTNCPDAMYGDGSVAYFSQCEGWTCAAFRQIGASQE